MWFRDPSGWARRVLRGRGRAGWLCGSARGPGSLGPGAGRRKRAAGPAAPLCARPCAGSPAPLCDPRRCARGGGGGGAGRGAGGGASSSAAGPALRPIGWALPPSGGRGGKCWARSAVLKRAGGQWGGGGGDPGLLNRTASGSRICPLADVLPLWAKAPPRRPHCHCPWAPLRLSGRTPHLRTSAWLGTTLPTALQDTHRKGLFLLYFLASSLLGSGPSEWPPQLFGPQSFRL